MKSIFKKIFYPFIAGLTMLTKFNLPCLKNLIYADSNITNSVVYFPVIGLLYGTILYYFNFMMICLNISVLFRSTAVLCLPFLMNNFFHFDGLCDMLDAFLANKSRDVRLKILKDTNIGSFALGGAILFMILKFTGLYSFLSKDNLPEFLILIPVYSKFTMVILAFKSKYPRENGTASLIVGRISMMKFILSLFIFILIIIGFLLIFSDKNNIMINLTFTLAITLVTIVFYVLFKLYSYKKIGGITGDVLGAANELVELIIIFSLLSIDKWIVK